MSAPAGSAVATGVVTVDGRPAAGAVVLATATASQQVQARLAVGDVLPTLSFVRVVADGAGRFSVPLAHAGLPPQFVGSGGQVDLVLDIAAGSRQTRWHVSARPTGSGWTTAGASVPHADRVVADLGARPTIADDVRPTTRVSLAARQESTLQPGLRGAPDVPCHIIVSEQKLGLNEAWLDAWGWGGGSITAEQDTSAASTIGIGESYNGGAWGESGTATVSVTNGMQDSVSRIVNAGVYNRVNANHYVTQACPIPDEYWQVTGFYATVTPIVTTTHRYFTQTCIARSATWSAKIYQQKNHTFAAGVNFGIISVSSTSGYTSTASETFTDSRASWECGDSVNGLAQSDQIEVHSQ